MIASDFVCVFRNNTRMAYEWIFKEMIDRGMNQKRVAAMLGHSDPSYINKTFAGIRKLRPEEAVIISNEWNKTLEWVWTGKESQPALSESPAAFPTEHIIAETALIQCGEIVARIAQKEGVKLQKDALFRFIARVYRMALEEANNKKTKVDGTVIELAVYRALREIERVKR